MSADGEALAPATGIAAPGADVPWREEDRLAALARYAILDTGREASFDEVAAIAADLFEAPLAVVNLIAADRQWFKAEVGIGADSLPLDVSICRHAILRPGVMVVPDLRLDPRFDGNPLIHVAGGLRFYAGALLETPEGLPLGLVCVLGREPRPEGITPRQERMLRALAAQVMALLEARRATAEAQAATQARTFLLDLEGRLRDEADPVALLGAATERLSRHLGVAWVGFGQVDEAGAHAAVHRDWTDGRAPGVAGAWRVDDLGPAVASDLRAGRTVAIPDVAQDPRTGAPEVVAALRAIQTRAVLGVPLVKAGRLRAMLLAHHPEPRLWTTEEVALAEGTCERLWSAVERARAAAARQRAEVALAESEARFRNMADHAPVMMWTTNPEGACTYLNRGWHEFTGQSREEALGLGWLEATHPDDRAEAGRVFLEANAVRAPFRIDYRLRRADGAYRWAIDAAAPRFGPEAEFLGYIGSVIDITERREAEEALRALNADLEGQVAERTRERTVTWEVSADLLGALDPQGYFRTSNPAWLSLLGWTAEEVASQPIWELMHPADLERTREGFRLTPMGEPAIRFPNRYRHKDGSYRWVSWVGIPVDGMVYCTGRDVTVEREQAAALAQAEDMLRQAQKMEAVGQLTGGLAHDFNNLLAGISGSLELMGTRIAQGRMADVERYLVAAQGAARRAAALTHRLLAFSRRQTLEPRVTGLGALVAGMEDLIRQTVGPAVAVESVAGGGLWNVLVDPNQLENALLNLVINARDAMPDGGRLTIEAANRTLDERAARESDLQPGQYVSLCVSDTGTGMAPEVAARAFDPFFTTKPIGLGTGLGLSMVYGFARQSGGQARITSEVGGGTAISLTLPRHLGEVEDVGTQAKASGLAKAEAGETVLVIDDEPVVRMLVVDVLREMSCAALEAGDGPAGLRVLQSGARVDLLVTDVGLPGGLNGRQVADAARALRPGLKVLFITGYAENAVLNHGHLEPGMEIVTKPFAVEELARRIKAMLSRD